MLAELLAVVIFPLFYRELWGLISPVSEGANFFLSGGGNETT